MKDQYVGDVNDYFKYALLRALASPDDLAVGWMLTAPDGRQDGQKLSYLSQPEIYRRLDPPLFDVLQRLVATEHRRSLAGIEKSDALTGAIFASGSLADDASARSQYFDRFWEAAAGRHLVFFDPDNGMGIASVSKGRRGSSKYLYWDELAVTYRLHHSVLVYQHFPRRPRQAFIHDIADRVRETTSCARPLAIATSNVAFFLLPQADRVDDLAARAEEFCAHASPFAAAVRFG